MGSVVKACRAEAPEGGICPETSGYLLELGTIAPMAAECCCVRERMKMDRKAESVYEVKVLAEMDAASSAADGLRE